MFMPEYKATKEALQKIIDAPKFERLTIPVFGRVFPSLIAEDLIGVQLMTAPTGKIFKIAFVNKAPSKPKDFFDGYEYLFEVE